MSDADLAERLRRLEDIEAICQLKARYFHACDAKNPQGMRDCFMPGPVVIDYGAVGRFEDREQLVDLFSRLACQPHIAEMHHGSNPVIVPSGTDRAHGRWSLHYQQIDLSSGRLTQLGAHYEDEYRRHEGRWLISATSCTVSSMLVLDLAGETAGVLLKAGAQAARA